MVVVSGVNDVRIQNVKLFTPENNLYGDRSLSITDCTNVMLSDVFLDGTYSQPDHFGYGVSLNNIWNFKAIRMYGKADWGIFGSNDVNTVSIEDSRINRFTRFRLTAWWKRFLETDTRSLMVTGRLSSCRNRKTTR